MPPPTTTVCARFFGFAAIDPGIIFPLPPPPLPIARRRVCDGLACGRGTTGRRVGGVRGDTCRRAAAVEGRSRRRAAGRGRTRQSEIGERVEVCGGRRRRASAAGVTKKRKKRKQKKCQSKLKRTGVSDNNLMRFDLRPPPCDAAAAVDDDDDDDARLLCSIRNRIISTEVLRARRRENPSRTYTPPRRPSIRSSRVERRSSRLSVGIRATAAAAATRERRTVGARVCII